MEKGLAEVPGILCGVGRGGIKEKGPDVLLVVTKEPAVFAGVFTANDVKSASVRFSMGVKGRIGGIVANSGNANACTGKRGFEDARRMAELARKYSGRDLPFLVASTGVIGELLPMEKVEAGIREASENLGRAKGRDPAVAIMTTDTFPKLAFREGKGFVVGGIAKGAGMIDPSMATMLAFVATSAEVPENLLRRALKDAVNESFNRITVDGDMSTNDCVFLVSTGKGRRINGEHFPEFKAVLTEVLKELAYKIVSDGEGATRVVRVIVEGAETPEQAERVARRIAGSLLVKTAIFGRDPNWGRILAVAGSAGTGIKEEKLKLFMGEHLLFKEGERAEVDEERIREYMNTNREILIRLDLNLGRESFECLTCDLTYEYVRINAEYRT